MPEAEAEADGAKQEPRGSDNGGAKASATKAAKPVTAGSHGSAPDHRSKAEQVDSSSEEDSDSDENEKDEDDDEDQPLRKKAKAEVVHGLSGDEVDTSNIIEGGRRARRGGVSAAVQPGGSKAPEVADFSDDEW